MEQKLKIRRYITRQLKKNLLGVHDSKISQSSYYFFKGLKVRVSNHIGYSMSNNADISIITDSQDTDNFMVHSIAAGEITIVNYNQLKEILRTLAILPPFKYKNAELVTQMEGKQVKSNNLIVIPTHQPCRVSSIKVQEKDAFIFGYPISMFKPNQLTTIANIIASLK